MPTPRVSLRLGGYTLHAICQPTSQAPKWLFFFYHKHHMKMILYKNEFLGIYENIILNPQLSVFSKNEEQEL